ncbi:DUF4350 domain-containing protein [Halobacillus salinarum]|uniref:DUF4350 domain-containing protein n=1 Tax=Halobacillus salinarum TaxID=2932257 RepID=A0ABY4EKT1_9BACI|nr:DUF4350 domain-containing protein [Halobacillus salinarum]UOQ45030.1 DUF4350 domain-containing protein [Halobacillus salinarum]
MRRNKRAWIGLSITLIAVILLGMALSYSKPKDYADYLSTSPAPSGVKAFFTYLQKEHETSRWRSTPDRLPKERQDLLLMIEPSYSLDEEAMEEYTQWMESGGTIWLASNSPTGFFGIKEKPVESTSFPVIKNEAGDTMNGDVPARTRLVTNDQDQVLYKDQSGVIALKRNVGKGALIVSLSPGWLTNREILKKDHLQLAGGMLNETNAQDLLFDEFIHGKERKLTFLKLYPKWLLALVFQAFLLGLLWIWMKGKRYGPVFNPREETVRFGDERLRALAAWYVKGGFYEESLSIQEDYVRSLMKDRWGISKTKSWKEVQSLMGDKLPEHKLKKWSHYTKFLDELSGESRVRSKSYLTASKQLEEVRKEVEENE